ncbi:hypothetical protein LCGC14_1029560 [marine sediment metagenome]|uniref:Ribosome-binding factor A n=1 Tax=marine sediment metagenome TaxID=412755 RepID=A0A0F9NGS2_9ZZZZ|nr:30S ribosome-binding factor RbfA [Actinomycetota bacterium]
MSKRTEKVAQAIQHALGDILIKDIKDPKLNLVSISKVEVTPDLKIADVYFTSLRTPADTVKQRLVKAEGALKSRLVKKVRLKYTPNLRFFEDKSTEYTLEISKILQDLDKEESDEK